MEGLQRSAVSFRRQGSSGMVWDDKFLAGLNQLANEQEQQKKKEQEAENNGGNNNSGDVKREEDVDVKKKSEKDQQGPSGAGGGSPLPAIRVERSRSNGGGRGFRTGKVSPAIEPPSPRVSACGCFGKKSRASCGNKTRRRAAKKRVM